MKAYVLNTRHERKLRGDVTKRARHAFRTELTLDASLSPAGRAFDVYFVAVTQNVRYRIRPFLVAPIMQHLKAHNIVH